MKEVMIFFFLPNLLLAKNDSGHCFRKVTICVWCLKRPLSMVKPVNAGRWHHFPWKHKTSDSHVSPVICFSADKRGICGNETTTTIRVNKRRQMGLPGSILSGPSILYLGLAAHKYSNKIHLSMLLQNEMLWMKWREYLLPFPPQTWLWQK